MDETPLCETHKIEMDWHDCPWCDGTGINDVGIFERCTFCRGKRGRYECQACLAEVSQEEADALAIDLFHEMLDDIKREQQWTHSN